MTCGFNASNYYLKSLSSEIAPITAKEAGKWSEINQLIQLLNEKILPVYKDKIVDSVTVETGEAINDIKNTWKASIKVFKLLDPEQAENIDRFILLVNGHYTVYENRKDGFWQKWDETSGYKILDHIEKSLDAINSCFMDLARNTAVSFILDKKFIKVTNNP